MKWRGEYAVKEAEFCLCVGTALFMLRDGAEVMFPIIGSGEVLGVEEEDDTCCF